VATLKDMKTLLFNAVTIYYWVCDLLRVPFQEGNGTFLLVLFKMRSTRLDNILEKVSHGQCVKEREEIK
jgi:hypothetical protein